MKFIEQSTFCALSDNLPQNITAKKEHIVSQKSVQKKSSKKQPKISRWTPEQNVLYLRFLKQNLDKFTEKCPKKFLKFERMSFEIESKTPDQCRSHHQKMMMRFKSIQNIVSGKVPGAEQHVEDLSEKSEETEIIEKGVGENSELLIQNNQIIESTSQMEIQSEEQINPYSDQNLFDVLFEVEMF